MHRYIEAQKKSENSTSDEFTWSIVINFSKEIFGWRNIIGLRFSLLSTERKIHVKYVHIKLIFAPEMNQWNYSKVRYDTLKNFIYITFSFPDIYNKSSSLTRWFFFTAIQKQTKDLSRQNVNSIHYSIFQTHPLPSYFFFFFFGINSENNQNCLKQKVELPL